jgi:hypothetical protein
MIEQFSDVRIVVIRYNVDLASRFVNDSRAIPSSLYLYKAVTSA